MGGLPDVFLHKQELPEATRIEAGPRVSFRIEKGVKGPRACDVMVIAHVAKAAPSALRSALQPL